MNSMYRSIIWWSPLQGNQLLLPLIFSRLWQIWLCYVMCDRWTKNRSRSGCFSLLGQLKPRRPQSFFTAYSVNEFAWLSNMNSYGKQFCSAETIAGWHQFLNSATYAWRTKEGKWIKGHSLEHNSILDLIMQVKGIFQFWGFIQSFSHDVFFTIEQLRCYVNFSTMLFDVTLRIFIFSFPQSCSHKKSPPKRKWKVHTKAIIFGAEKFF